MPSANRFQNFRMPDESSLQMKTIKIWITIQRFSQRCNSGGNLLVPGINTFLPRFFYLLIVQRDLAFLANFVAR